MRDLADPLLQEFLYQYNTKGTTAYPTVRLDFNLTDRHRLSGSLNYTDLLSSPDSLNNREPQFPGFPGFGNQHSDRYTAQTTLRSTLTQNLVNEFKIGGSGGATHFSPEIGRQQFQGTSVADQGGFFLDINGDALGINNPAGTGSYSAREATTRILENTLSWLKGSHNVQVGFALHARRRVAAQPAVRADDHLRCLVERPGAEHVQQPATSPAPPTTQLNDARELYATLTGRVIGIAGELRLDENTDQYQYLGLGVQRARLEDYGFFVADTWRWKPNLTLNMGLRYELQRPFHPLNNSYSKATLDDVCGVSGVSANGGCNIFQPGRRPGSTPQFVQYNKGEGAYNTDYNNFAPSVGFAWTLPGERAASSAGCSGATKGTACCAPATRSATTVRACRTSPARSTTTPGISLPANRNHTLGNLGTPGTILFRDRGSLGPPDDLPTTRQYPMTDVITGDIVTFDPNLAGAVLADLDGRLAAQADERLRDRGPLRRHAFASELADVRLQRRRMQHGRERVPRRVQARAAEPAGQHRGRSRREFPLLRPGHRHVAAADLRRLLQRPDRCRQSARGAYSSSLFASSTFVNELATFNPDPDGMANSLDADAGTPRERAAAPGCRRTSS